MHADHHVDFRDAGRMIPPLFLPVSRQKKKYGRILRSPVILRLAHDSKAGYRRRKKRR